MGVVRESLQFIRGGDAKQTIGIGREKLIGDFVDEVNGMHNPRGIHMITPLKKEDKNAVLVRAVSLGRTDIIKLLLSDPEVNPAYRKNSIISTAALNGTVETIDILLSDDRVNPGDNHNEALYQAAKNNNLEAVKRLMKDPRVNPADAKESLDRDYNTVFSDNYIIIEAISHQNFEVIKELLKDPRVKIKRAIQLVVSKLSKALSQEGFLGSMGAVDKWSSILGYLIDHRKAQEELTDKEISRIKEKINKI